MAVQTSSYRARDSRWTSFAYPGHREEPWSYSSTGQGQPKPSSQEEGELRESQEKGQVDACRLLWRSGCSGWSVPGRKDGYLDYFKVETFLDLAPLVQGDAYLYLSADQDVSASYNAAQRRDVWFNTAVNKSRSCCAVDHCQVREDPD